MDFNKLIALAKRLNITLTQGMTLAEVLVAIAAHLDALATPAARLAAIGSDIVVPAGAIVVDYLGHKHKALPYLQEVFDGADEEIFRTAFAIAVPATTTPPQTPPIIEDEDDFGLDSDGNVLDGHSRLVRSTDNVEKVYRHSTFAQFKAAKALYWEKAKLTLQSASVRDGSGGVGAKGAYKTVDFKGDLYHRGNPSGDEGITLQPNSSYLTAAQSIFTGVGIAVGRHGVPALEGKEPLLVLWVSNSVQGTSISMTSNPNWVEQMKADGAETVMIRKKECAFFVDKTTSDQPSFQSIISIASTAKSNLLNKEQDYRMRKSVDVEYTSAELLARVNFYKNAGPEILAAIASLEAAGMSNADAIKMIQGK